MQFSALENEDQLREIKDAIDFSIILKHNTTCPISKGVLERLHDQAGEIRGAGTIHVLDLLAFRDVSNAVAAQFGVPHRSPQLLLVKNGRCVYHEWGFDISAADIQKAIDRQAVS